MIWFDEDYWYGIEDDFAECSEFSELFGYEIDLDDPQVIHLLLRLSKQYDEVEKCK